MIKVGDIIDGRKVTKVYNLCGMEAYQSEPVPVDNAKFFPEELPELGKPKQIIEPEETEDSEEKPKRGRRKKEV